MHRPAKLCHTGGPMTSIGLYNFLPDIIHTKTGQALLVLGSARLRFLWMAHSAGCSARMDSSAFFTRFNRLVAWRG